MVVVAGSAADSSRCASRSEYNFSVVESGTTKLYINGRLVSQRVRDDFGYTDHVTVRLRAGRATAIT